MDLLTLIKAGKFPEKPSAIQLAQLAATLNPQLCARDPGEALEDALLFLERAHVHAAMFDARVKEYHHQKQLELARDPASLHEIKLKFVPSEIEDELRQYILAKQPSLDVKKGSSVRVKMQEFDADNATLLDHLILQLGPRFVRWPEFERREQKVNGSNPPTYIISSEYIDALVEWMIKVRSITQQLRQSEKPPTYAEIICRLSDRDRSVFVHDSDLQPPAEPGVGWKLSETEFEQKAKEIFTKLVSFRPC